MIDQGKREILGVLVDAIDYEAAVERVRQAAEAKRALGATALAVHGVMTGVLDRVHCYRLNHLDMVVPDGQPVRWALNLLYGAKLSDRVYGPTLMLKICAMAAVCELPIFLYGSKPEVLAALSDQLRQNFPDLIIAGGRPSQFRRLSEDEQLAIADTIRKSGAAITFVGLGCPRQEVWVYEHLKHLDMPVLAVGAAFDFHAGLLPQAPPVMQRLGLEWLFRLVQEPRRLWRRYLLLNPAYLTLLCLRMLGVPLTRAASAKPPTQLLRYG
jgi:N-acetylglucosaminyldiphosphoundecaprenol N-acetyl-beta-D-mannosaminyltransferase